MPPFIWNVTSFFSADFSLPLQATKVGFAVLKNCFVVLFAYMEFFLKLKELESMTGRASFTVQPDYIFELDYQNTRSKKFAEYAEKYDVKLGYHGSRMDNFHSILHNGLQVHMTKVILYYSVKTVS